MRRSPVWKRRPLHPTILFWHWPNWLAVILASSSLLAFLIPKWLLDHGHRPPVGVYIAIMGLVVAIMTLRKEPSPAEKFWWVVLATVLMVAEIQSLYRADAVQTTTFSRITENLDATRKGLDAAAGKIQDTASELNKLYSETTGGDSYIYFEIAEASIGGPLEMDGAGLRKGMMVANTYSKFVGTFPLHHVYVTQIGPRGEEANIDYGDMFPVEMGRPRQAPYIYFYPDRPIQFIAFIISTSNGNYSQTVLVEKIAGKWLWASKFRKYGSKTPSRTWSAPGFPADELHADWSKLR
jgi:hypothetical protein